MSLKHKISRAALDIFVAEGVDAATTKKIAERAEASEGALYRHWKSKDELALDLFLGAHRRLSDLIESSAAQADGIDAKAAAIVKAYGEVADEDWRLFTFHLLHLNHFLHAWPDDGRDPVTQVERVVRDAIAAGELPPADARLLAAMAMGVITQTAQNKAYGRLGAARLSDFIPALTAAVQAVLWAR